MRSMASSLLVALALTSAFGVAAGETPEAQLTESEKSAWEGWKSSDATPFEKYLASNAQVILADGSEYGKAEVLEMISSGGCEVAGYELSDFRFQPMGDHAAILTYHASQDAVCDGQKIPPRLVVSSVWSHDGDRWWNVLYQETVVLAHEE